MASQQKASEDYSGPRLHSQLGEVRTSSSPGFLFPWGQIQASSSSYRPISGQHCLYYSGSSQASGSQTSLSTSIILHSGSNGVNGQSSTTRESFQEISSVGTQREVVSKACLVGQHYSSRTVVCLGSRSLDRYGLSDIDVSPSSSFSSTPSLHRFELGGLGSSYGQSYGLRLLVHNREGTTHQCVRNEGGLVSSAGFCSSYQGSLGVASNGQHHCCSLHKQTGGGTHSRTLCNLAVEAAEWCARNKVHLKARYLPGRLNALADCLSRKGAVVQTEWSLNQRVASQIFHIWGSPHIDLFATHLNRKLPLFVSPVLETEAYATDTLSFSWVGMLAYAFPPFPLILTCLRKIQIEECLVCLVAPLWEGQAWFPLLLSLLVAPAVCLPWKEDLLYQPISRMLHPTPKCSVFTLGCYATTHASVRHF